LTKGTSTDIIVVDIGKEVRYRVSLSVFMYDRK